MPGTEFEKPLYINGRRFWKQSGLVNYERALAGEPPLPPPDPADERYLCAAQVRQRYGGVSDMWLWRRLHEGEQASAEPGCGSHERALARTGWRQRGTKAR